MPDLNLPPIDPSALDAYLAGNPPDGRFAFAEPAPSALVIDFADPDPAPVGDPWPYHLCMPSVEWPAPVGPVLRRDHRSEPLMLRAHAAAVRVGVDRAALTAVRRRARYALLVAGLVWVAVVVAVVLLARLHPAFSTTALLP